MRITVKHLVAFSLTFLLAGCATRVGSSKKLEGYDVKLKNLTVVYSQGKFSDERMNKKLERYNFQNMGEYVAKTAPQTFTNYGINASVYTQTANSDKPSPREQQILFISPVKVETTGHNGVVGTGPSMDPVKVKFEINMFDALVKKEVWSADFSVVAGGLLYSSFSEEKAAAFLNDILGKMEADGLVEKLSSAQK